MPIVLLILAWWILPWWLAVICTVLIFASY